MNHLISCFTLLICIHGIAQNEPSFIRTYGMPDGFHYGVRITVLNDSTYMLLGNKNGFHGTNNIYVLHVDWQGMIIQDEVYGGTSLWHATDMVAYHDSIFWICGYTLNTITHDYDALLLKINKDLELLDWIIFGSQEWDFARALTVDESQNVYVTSSTYVNGSRQSIHITKFDQNLNLLDEYYKSYMNAHIIPGAVSILNDSLLFICGHFTADTGKSTGFIYKMDTHLNLLDSILIFDAQADIEIRDIDVSDTTVFITGKWSSAINQSHKFLYGMYNTNFQQLHFETSQSTNDWCNCIKFSDDLSLTVFGGISYIFGAGGGDFLFFIFHQQWYVTSGTIGKSLYEEVFDCDFALDSTVVLIGTTRSYGQNHSSIMFAKTCKTFHCPQEHLHQTDILETTSVCFPAIYPNPTTDNLFVRFCENMMPPITLTIYTPEGKLIAQELVHSPQPENIYLLNTQFLPPGTYFMSITHWKNTVYTRFIKLE